MSQIGIPGSNPLVPLGQLNRLRASVLWTSFPNLNVTRSFLGKEGIRFTEEGDAVPMLEAMTGVVPSPEAYVLVAFRIALLKSQALSDAYKQQRALNALLGNCTIRPDASTLSPFQLYNCAIVSVEAMQFNGEEVIFPVNCRGTYPQNSSLFNSN